MKKVDFSLSSIFVRNKCMKAINSNGICPFLECEGKKFRCINFTQEGVDLHRKIRRKETKLVGSGCDIVIFGIINNKNFKIGQRLEYTDGANTEDKKTFEGFKYFPEKKLFTVLIKGKNDTLPFPISINTDYLAISESEDENTISVTNQLGYGNSVDIYIR